MKPLFSLLHATYGRTTKAIDAMKLALARASNPSQVEYIFACNNDDKEFSKFMVPDAPWAKTMIVIGNYTGSSPAWNAAANASSGEILIQMQDDLELPEMWDAHILRRLRELPFDGGPDGWKGLSIFVGVSDGYRKDDLCCTAIMNRMRYTQQGEFLHPGYMSVFSDDDVTYRAIRDAKAGRCVFVSARDLVFTHRHHYHDKSVPMDATYQRENSAEAYRIGSELFLKRNPESTKDGIVTWR